jgi:hypothetical protein
MVSDTQHIEAGSPLAPPHDDAAAYVEDEALVVRNYDATETTVVVTFHEDDKRLLQRQYTLAPDGCVSFVTPFRRAVYDVTARVLDGDEDSAECLLGDAPSEAALVEVGNGLVSVADGIY